MWTSCSARLQAVVQELDHLIRAKYPVIMLETTEEQRALGLIREAAVLPIRRGRPEKPVFLWSIAVGLRAIQPDGGHAPVTAYEAAEPAQVLRAILSMDRPALVVLADFVPHLLPYGQEDAGLVRLLREVAFGLKVRANGPTVLLTGVLWPAIPTLADEVKVVTVPLPDEAEIAAFVREQARGYADNGDMRQAELGDAALEPLVRALLGLPLTAIDNLLARAAVTHRAVDGAAVPLFLREKCDLLRRSGSLTYADPEPPDHFAGYPALRRRLARMALALSDEARRYGVARPKGILLVGLPGCGKDLCKRVAAAVLGRPLLNLDFGAVMGARGGVVGQAHQEVRQALAIAETMQAILGISEFEKAVGGLASSNASDGGETARTIAHLLAWMADQDRVVTFATANDVRGLAPEQIRHGRFDQVLWVDLPSRDGRRDIGAVHLRRWGRDPAGFDLDALAERTEQFSGAEIETVVKEAILRAFEAGSPDVRTADLLAAAAATRPLAVVRGREIAELRDWAAALQLPNAESDQVVEPASPGSRAIDV